jgi:probable H4MPT-linked C1 transfer pathway protein
MPSTILGLDIGGANLKVATADKRAISEPFKLWKQPDKLPKALADLVARFPDAEELAVTMTGELCDCFETKRAGVHALVAAVQFASAGRPLSVWSTDGEFVTPETAKRNHLKIAAGNWHVLATFAGRYAPKAGGLLIDIGSTTTDIIPLHDGVPCPTGRTDWIRLQTRELVYRGIRRTPVCAVKSSPLCAELFATTQDAYVVLGMISEAPDNLETADGRPLTRGHSLARLARMLGGDRETVPDESTIEFAGEVHRLMLAELGEAARFTYNGFSRNLYELRTVITSGAGEFLARRVTEELVRNAPIQRIVSLNEELGPAVSACAPAYAVAVLATERG